MPHGRLFSNFTWLILAQIISKLTTLAALFFLARYLGDELFGRYAVALAIPTVLEPLADLGVSQALVREGAGRPELTRRLAIAALLPKLGLAVLIVAATYMASLELALPQEVVDAALFLAIAKALESITYLARAVFQANERMEYEAALTGVDGVMRLVFITYALLSGFGLVGLAKALALSSFVVMLATIIVVTHRFLLPLAFRLKPPVRLFIDGLPLAVVWLLDALVLRIGIVSSASLLGDAATGILAAAVRLVEPTLIVPAMMAAALLPLASRHLLQVPATVPWLFHASLKMAVLVALAGSTILIGLSSSLVEFVFGPDFAAAAVLVRVLSLSLVPLFVHVLLVAFLLAFREQWLVIVTLILGVVVNAAVAIGLASAWGTLAPAFGVFAGELVTIGAMLAVLPRLRALGFVDAVRPVALLVPILAVLALGDLIGEVPSTTLALVILVAAIRFFAFVHERELVYLQDVAPRFRWLSRLLLAPLMSR